MRCAFWSHTGQREFHLLVNKNRDATRDAPGVNLTSLCETDSPERDRKKNGSEKQCVENRSSFGLKGTEVALNGRGKQRGHPPEGGSPRVPRTSGSRPRGGFWRCAGKGGWSGSTSDL